MRSAAECRFRREATLSNPMLPSSTILLTDPMAGRVKASIVGVLAAAAVSLPACTRGSPAPTPTTAASTGRTTTSPSVAAQPQPVARPFRVFAAGGSERPSIGWFVWTPYFIDRHPIAFGYGDAWVLARTNALYRIDASSHHVTRRLSIPGARFVATGAGAVWITARRQLIKVDPATATVVASTRFPRYVGSVAIFGHAVWMAHGSGNYDGGIWRIDPATLHIERSFHIGDEVQMVVANGSIWLFGPNLGWLERLDPATNRVVRTKTFVDRGSVLPGSGYLWITDQGSGSVRQIDASSGGVVRTWYLHHAESPASGPAFWCIPAAKTVSCLSNGLGRTFAWSIDPGTKTLTTAKPPRYLPSAYGLGSYWTLGRAGVVVTPLRS